MIIALHAFTTFVSLSLFLFAIYRRDAKRSLNLTYALFAVFLFNIGYFIELSAVTMDAATLGVQLKYLGLPFVSPFILLFLLDFYRGKSLSNSIKVILFIIPVLHCLVALTFPWNGIFYSSIAWAPDAAIPHLVSEKAFTYYVGFFYASGISMSSLIFTIYQSRISSGITKKQSAVLAAAVAIPGVGNALNVLVLPDLLFDPTSVLLGMGCILLGYSFLRLKLFQIAPIAREQIIESMREAFVLVDPNGVFIDANTAAKRIFPQLATARVGAIVDDIEGIPWAGEQRHMEKWSFDLQDESGELHHYSISKSAISQKDKVICDCIMIYDVTEAKRQLDEVSELAERDMLTGLINRGALFKRGEKLFQEIVSAGGGLSVFMMDLDYFKELNDTYGHQVGDEVLRIIAQNLSNRFRSTDLFARYGGEEFCAFLPQMDERSAIRLAEELCVNTERIDWGSKLPNLRVTISIGVAVFNATHAAYHDTLGALIGAADTALYAAKNAGRNTFRLYRSDFF